MKCVIAGGADMIPTMKKIICDTIIIVIVYHFLYLVKTMIISLSEKR